MVIIVCDSLVCRLCAENCINGLNLFDEEKGIHALVKKYLSLDVSDDGVLPQIICPGCHIHLQDTASFFDLVEKGQKKINDMYIAKPETSEQDFSLKENNLNEDKNNGIELTETVDFSKSIDDAILINNDQMLEEIPTKRKRGRPRKSENVPKKVEFSEPLLRATRVRKQPLRFSQTVVGQEWENAVNPDNIKDPLTEDLNNLEKEENEESVPIDSELNEGAIGCIQTEAGKVLGNVVTKRKKNSKSGLVTRLNCIICNKEFTHKSLLLRHLLKDQCGISDIVIDDIVGPTFNITSTDQEMNLLSSKIDDITVNRGKKQYICLLCQKSYPSRCSLLYHEEKEHTHHVYACSNCDKRFKHRLVLLRHQKAHTERRPYSCDICSLSFKYQSNLLHHKMSHTNIGRVECSFCPATFTSKRSLEFHIRAHVGYKPHQCHVCHKDFSQKNNLLEHLRVHSGEKPYKCTSCNRDFKTSSQLRTHSLTHSEIKPHICQICKKSFRHKDSWCAHIRRHKGEKPFSCTHCGKSFLEGTGVRKHERMHTGEKRFACKHCDKPFADCSNLNKHRKKVHGEGSENNLARDIYLHLSLPDQDLNHLDLGHINDETNTNSISALNLGLGDCEAEIQVGGSSLQTKSIPIMFKSLEQEAMKNKELNLTLDFQNDLDPNNQLSVPLVLKNLGSTVSNKVGDTPLPIFSAESMPLVLKTLEESGCRGKDMPLVLDGDGTDSDSLRLVQGALSSTQNTMQVQLQHNENRDSLSLAISDSQSQIQELKDLSLVQSSRQVVLGEQGVPIKITMTDGTQLQVTTTDGESLEVIPVMSAPEYEIPHTLPNIDALTMEGALGVLTHLSQDYEIQFVGHSIKLLPTTADQDMKLIHTSHVDQSIKLLTSAEEAHCIDLLTSAHGGDTIKLIPSESDDESIKLIQSTGKLSDETPDIDLLSSEDGTASIKLLTSSDGNILTSSVPGTSLSPPSSPSHLKWALHQ